MVNQRYQMLMEYSADLLTRTASIEQSLIELDTILAIDRPVAQALLYQVIDELPTVARD